MVQSVYEMVGCIMFIVGKQSKMSIVIIIYIFIFYFVQKQSFVIVIYIKGGFFFS